MPQWKKNVYVLWLAVFLAGICWTMVMPFTPVFLRQLGVAPGVEEFWSGIIIAVASVCSMVMAPIWGAIGDRYGRRMMMLRAGLFLMLGYILLALVQSPLQLLLVRMMIGLLTGFVPMAIALIGVSTPRQHVGWALGLIQTGYPAGAIIGPVVGGLASDWIGIRGASWVSAVLIAVPLLMAMIIVKEEFTPTPRGQNNLVTELKAAATHKVLVAIVLITVISQATVMSLEPVLVPFVQQIAGANAPGWLAGLLYSIPGATYVLMAPWWARRGEQLGFERTVSLGLLATSGFYFLQTFVMSPWQLGGLRLATGLTTAAIDPGVAAMIATAVPSALQGRAFGLNQAAGSAGSIVGPLLGGWIASYINPRGVFVMVGLLCVAGFFWVKRVVGPQVRAASMQHKAGINGQQDEAIG
ncbi:MAG: MFS transporter [Mycobacterium leprae]